MRKSRNPRIPIPRSESSYSSHVMTPSLRARPLEQTIVTVSLGIFQVRRIEIVRPGGRKPVLDHIHHDIGRVVMPRGVGFSRGAFRAVLEKQTVAAIVLFAVLDREGVDFGSRRGQPLVDLGRE